MCVKVVIVAFAVVDDVVVDDEVAVAVTLDVAAVVVVYCSCSCCCLIKSCFSARCVRVKSQKSQGKGRVEAFSFRDVACAQNHHQ